MLYERVMSSSTINEVRTATWKKFSKANLLENALHSRPANEPKPAPPTIRWQQCSSRAINRIAKIIFKQTPRDFPTSYWCPYTAGLLRGSVATRDKWLLRQNVHPCLRETMVRRMACISEMLGERRRDVIRGIRQAGGVYIDSIGVAG